MNYIWLLFIAGGVFCFTSGKKLLTGSSKYGRRIDIIPDKIKKVINIIIGILLIITGIFGISGKI